MFIILIHCFLDLLSPFRVKEHEYKHTENGPKLMEIVSPYVM